MNPQATQLDGILSQLKAKGASADEMSTVARGFLNKVSKPTPVDTSQMERSRLVPNSYRASGQNREYLDTTTGKYVSEEQSSLGQRLKGLTETFVDPAARFLSSAVRVPQDIISSIFGSGQQSDYKVPLPSGKAPAPTFQREFQTNTLPAVQAGTMTPLQGTLDVTGKTVEGAGSFLGIADAGVGLVKKVPGLASDIISGVSSKVSALKNAVISPAKNDLQVIADTISHKLTAAEKRLALSQGRIIDGTQPTIFRSGTPQQVLTSDKVTQSAFTINKEIPGAAKMSEPELFTALDARTTDMAVKLKPQMKAVKVQSDAITKMNSDWQKLRKLQVDSGDVVYDKGGKLIPDPNLVNLQNKFEARLAKAQKGGTYDDLWQERINYDNSIPDAVKKANINSDARLLAKKEMWLQNRQILNNAITDAESNIPANVKMIFKDMSNMYNAKANLLSKASVDLVSQSSKVVQWMKAHPYLTGAIATGAASVTGIPRTALRLVTGL